MIWGNYMDSLHLVEFPTLPFASCVILDKLLNLSDSVSSYVNLCLGLIIISLCYEDYVRYCP